MYMIRFWNDLAHLMSFQNLFPYDYRRSITACAISVGTYAFQAFAVDIACAVTINEHLFNSFSIASATWGKSRNDGIIIAADKIVPNGFAKFWPIISGAEPWIGSYNAVPSTHGCRW